MKYRDGQYYVEVKDQRYKFFPTEDISLGKGNPPQLLRTQNQVQCETQFRKKIKMLSERLENYKLKKILRIENKPIFNN